MSNLLTKEEKNRIIAEWLGFLKPTKEETEEVLRDRRYELRRWTLHRTSNAPIENFSSYYWTGPDYFNSENDSAQILEAMPAVELYCHPADHIGPEKGWRCRPDWGLDAAVYNADRKTAIAEAALLLIQKDMK